MLTEGSFLPEAIGRVLQGRASRSEATRRRMPLSSEALSNGNALPGVMMSSELTRNA